MKLLKDIEEFQESLIHKYEKICDHKEDGIKEIGYRLSKCECKKLIALQVRLYKYNVPRRFWDKGSKDVKQSKDLYENLVASYCKHINKALVNGLGLFFTGDNGTGKTLFMSIIAKNIAYKTGYSLYYTTMPDLVQNIYRTNGFNDEQRDMRMELDSCIRKTDFLFIDELGKGDPTPYVRTYIESALRFRHDNKLPFIIGSNLSLSDLSNAGSDSNYGETIKSLIEGSCEIVSTAPGDFRPKLYDKLSAVIYNTSQLQKVVIDDFS